MGLLKKKNLKEVLKLCFQMNKMIKFYKNITAELFNLSSDMKFLNMFEYCTPNPTKRDKSVGKNNLSCSLYISRIKAVANSS